jgi:GNAT superfamily N-acetyltransferase
MSAVRPCRLLPLSWDSELFGIRVAELRVAAATRSEVHQCLEEHAADFDLIYVRGAQPEIMNDEVLAAYGGTQADDRATFSISPIPPARRSQIPVGASDSESLRTERVEGRVESVAPGAASDEIIDLAIQSSTHSRFRRDPSFDDAWVDRLYRVWIERAVARERADEVLVFIHEDRAVGLYTLRVEADTGHLDLFAVDGSFRRKGVGGELLAAGFAWMRDHGVGRGAVATQLDNPVCRLYRAFGYSLDQTEAIYHLWPGSPGTSSRSSTTS